MKPFRIFGIGSPFGDDQAGWKVIDILQNKTLSNHWHLEQCDRPHLRLLELMQNAQLVILIDAVKSEAKCGQIHCWQDLSDFNLTNSTISSHGWGLAQTLQLAKTLHCLPEKIIVYGIEIQEIFHGSLSQPVQAATQQLAEMISDLVQTF